jgi:hypothetical protein
VPTFPGFFFRFLFYPENVGGNSPETWVDFYGTTDITFQKTQVLEILQISNDSSLVRLLCIFVPVRS